MTNTICYKTKEPTYYNKGTARETSCDTFLAYYCYGKNRAELEGHITKINNEKPDTIDVFGKVDWNEIDHFSYMNRKKCTKS